MNKAYELMVIFPVTMGDSEQKKVFDTVKNQIKKGKVVSTKDFGRRKLAFPIKKQEEGNYFLITLEAAGDEVAQLGKRLATMESLLRYLITIHIPTQAIAQTEKPGKSNS